MGRPKKQEKPRYRVPAGSSRDASGTPSRYTDHRDSQVAQQDKPHTISMADIEAALRKQPAQECPSAAPDTSIDNGADFEIDQALAEKAKAAKQRHLNQPRDGGEFTSPRKLAKEKAKRDSCHAALRRDVEDETWFQAMDALGITWAFRAFCLVVGAGAGVASIIWFANQVMP